MTFGPLDEPTKLGPSEYDDDDLGWAGRGDLGISKGRQPTGGELAAKIRRDQNRDLPYVESPDAVPWPD